MFIELTIIFVRILYEARQACFLIIPWAHADPQAPHLNILSCNNNGHGHIITLKTQ